MIRLAEEADKPALAKIMIETDSAIPGIDYSSWTYPIIVCEMDGEVVGLIHAILAKPITFITTVAVLPAYTKRGVGRALVDAMEILFKQLDVKDYMGWARPGSRMEQGMLQRGLIPINTVTEYLGRV